MRRIIALPILLCCADQDPCPAGGWVADERGSFVSLPDGTPLQVLMPAHLGRYPDGAPAIVYVRGGWKTDALPVQEMSMRFGSGRGVLQVYLDLPDDVRGAESRSAVAAALRYAAGEALDTEMCSIEDRSGISLSGQLALVSYSNGANLAWSTLADPQLSLPEVDGVVMFEPPVSSQVALLDLLHTDYMPGDCALDKRLALSCAVSYDGIVAQGEALWLEQGKQRTALAGQTDPDSGTWVPSSEAASAAADAGIKAPWLASPPEALAFWSVREASQQLKGAVAQFPDLAVIMTATEQDHVQASLPDQPHVMGMMEAMALAGVRWHRLNPDASYAVLETGAPAATAEHPANTVFQVSDAPPQMPEEVGAGRGLMTAATLEILDRTHEEDWRDDLEVLLFH